MPAAFDACNEAGGRIRTVTKGSNKGRLICCRGKKSNGNCVLGEVRGSGKFTMEDMKLGYKVV